jgi:hypothetical protein
VSTPRPRYNYHGLLRHLEGGRDKRERPTDVKCLRVYLSREGNPCVRMYNTTIAEFRENDEIVVSMGGWTESMTTRSRVGEVTGLRVGTIAQHKKRAVSETTRAYAGYGFPFGVPFEDGIVVKHGSVVHHPAMERQNVTLFEITEDVLVVNKVIEKTYRDLRRALLKQFKPLVHFVSEENLDGYYFPRDLSSWFHDMLLSPPSEEDSMDTLCHLMSLGKSENRNYWGKLPTFDPHATLKRALAKCAGASSWDILAEFDGIDTQRVRSREI